MRRTSASVMWCTCECLCIFEAAFAESPASSMSPARTTACASLPFRTPSGGSSSTSPPYAVSCLFARRRRPDSPSKEPVGSSEDVYSPTCAIVFAASCQARGARPPPATGGVAGRPSQRRLLLLLLVVVPRALQAASVPKPPQSRLEAPGRHRIQALSAGWPTPLLRQRANQQGTCRRAARPEVQPLAFYGSGGWEPCAPVARGWSRRLEVQQLPWCHSFGPRTRQSRFGPIGAPILSSPDTRADCAGPSTQVATATPRMLRQTEAESVS
mmetsp:Transcript_69/g.206  ORF Transcript_69/g.206 Transcript_69/m.206 type:complete len:270 (-) Transcript_69:1110-1919(-)